MNKAVFIRCFRNYSLLVLFLVALAYTSPYIISISNELLADFTALILNSRVASGMLLSISIFAYGIFFAIFSYDSKSFLDSSVPRLSGSFKRLSSSLLILIYAALFLININLVMEINIEEQDLIGIVKFVLPLGMSGAMTLITSVNCFFSWRDGSKIDEINQSR